MGIRVLALLSHVRRTTFSYELSNRIHEQTDADVTVVSYEDESFDPVEAPVKGTVEVVPLGARSRFDRRAIGRLRSLLATGEFDLLHTHHNFVGALGRALVPREMAIVDTEHGNHRMNYSVLQNLVNNTTLWRADRIVANSEQTCGSFYTLEQMLLPRNHVDVIYNGVDMDRIDRVLAESDNPYAIDGRRIIMVGRMIEVKNMTTIVRAFLTLADRLPETQLTLVGDGPYRDRLEQIVADSDLDDRVQFTGLIPREDVYRLLDASDVFVVPSFSEGFCVAAVEAMACGLPIVASNIEVLREVIGETGTFADPADPLAFAEQIEVVLTNDSYRTIMADKARTRARIRFSLDQTAREYHRLYTQLV